MWVPAHEGVSPNSYADAAAKAYLRAGEVEDVTTVVASEVRSRDCLYERRVLRTRVSPARTSVRARDFFAILCRFRPPNAHFSVRTGVSQRRTPSGRGDSAGSPRVGIPTPAHQSSSKLQQALQQASAVSSSGELDHRYAVGHVQGHRQGLQRCACPCFGGRAPQGEIVLSRGARARAFAQICSARITRLASRRSS